MSNKLKTILINLVLIIAFIVTMITFLKLTNSPNIDSPPDDTKDLQNTELTTVTDEE